MSEQPYPELPKKSKDVLRQLTNMDPDHVAFSLEVARGLFANEQQRNRDIEQKATILVGAAGIAAAVLLSIAGFLVRSGTMLAGWPRGVLAVFFGLLAVTFFLSILQAIKVLLVGKAHYPGAMIVLESQSQKHVEYVRAHVADLFAAFSNNIERNNRKAGLLYWAQIFFAAFVCVLLVTGLFTVGVSLWLD